MLIIVNKAVTKVTKYPKLNQKKNSFDRLSFFFEIVIKSYKICNLDNTIM